MSNTGPINDLLKPQPAPKDTGSRPIWPLVVDYVEHQMAEVDGLAALRLVR